MRKREIERYRSLLEQQLTALIGQGEKAVHQMVGEGEEIPDPNDRATVEEERNWSLRLRDRDRRLIGKIQQALARLATGTFGTCTSCGRAIAAARLRARPVTDLCIACKTDADCNRDKDRHEFCVNQQCQQCRDDRDCPAGKMCNKGRCDPIPGYCDTDNMCPPNTSCIEHRCRACTADAIASSISPSSAP